MCECYVFEVIKGEKVYISLSIFVLFVRLYIPVLFTIQTQESTSILNNARVDLNRKIKLKNFIFREESRFIPRMIFYLFHSMSDT